LLFVPAGLVPRWTTTTERIPADVPSLYRGRARRLAAPKGSAALDGVPASRNVITDSFLVVKDQLHAPSLCFVSLFVTSSPPAQGCHSCSQPEQFWHSLGRGALAAAGPGLARRGAAARTLQVVWSAPRNVPVSPWRPRPTTAARALLRRPRPQNGFQGLLAEWLPNWATYHVGQDRARVGIQFSHSDAHR
jgi:hypothetical protein